MRVVVARRRQRCRVSCESHPIHRRLRPSDACPPRACRRGPRSCSSSVSAAGSIEIPAFAPAAVAACTGREGAGHPAALSVLAGIEAASGMVGAGPSVASGSSLVGGGGRGLAARLVGSPACDSRCSGCRIAGWIVLWHKTPENPKVVRWMLVITGKLLSLLCARVTKSGRIRTG